MSSFYSNKRPLSRRNKIFLVRIIIGAIAVIGYVIWNPFHVVAWADITTGAIFMLMIALNARVF